MRLRKIEGFQLIEVVMALGIVAGPAIYGISLIHSDVHAARQDAQRAAAHALLWDVLEMVRSGSPATAASYCGSEGTAKLRALARRRLEYAGLVDGTRHRALLALADSLTATMDSGAGGVAGLTRLTVSAPVERGHTLRVSRYLRAFVTRKAGLLE